MNFILIKLIIDIFLINIFFKNDFGFSNLENIFLSTI